MPRNFKNEIQSGFFGEERTFLKNFNDIREGVLKRGLYTTCM